MGEGSGRPWPKVSRLYRFGPLVVVLAGVVAAGAVASVERGAPGPTRLSAAGSRHVSVPITYAAAVREGRAADYRWPAGCDRRTGRLAMPTIYAPPCVAQPSPGTSGGASANGVSAKSITVVYYQAPPGDLAAAIEGAAGNPALNFKMAQDFVAMFNKVVHPFGRTVHLVQFNATGTSADSVAARADAITVATQLHAFASIGGPAQSAVYAQQLAAMHVLCISCYTTDYAMVHQLAPYTWALMPTPDTVLTEAFNFIVHDVMGRDAIYAGEPAFRRRRRVLALVHYDQNPPVYGSLTQELDRRFGRQGLRFAVQESYLLDLTTLPDEAATIAAKLKRSGATTVVFAGDPIMPIYLTKACAAIGYFPEWIITGTVFTDTSTLGRYYDQAEWAHAFGISDLSVPLDFDQTQPYVLFHWFFGAHAAMPAPGTSTVILPEVQLLFQGLDTAGPYLTAATFGAGLFGAPAAGGSPTAPRSGFGEQGPPPRPAYSQPSDYTLIWYDARAQGPDEENVEGRGLIRYVDGGKRYPALEVPRTPPVFFHDAGTVLRYHTAPSGAQAPSYPPWPGSPAARASS